MKQSDKKGVTVLFIFLQKYLDILKSRCYIKVKESQSQIVIKGVLMYEYVRYYRKTAD